jgi:hypothetical protein
MSAAPIIRRTDPAPLDDRADHAMVRMRDGVRLSTSRRSRPTRSRAGSSWPGRWRREWSSARPPRRRTSTQSSATSRPTAALGDDDPCRCVSGAAAGQTLAAGGSHPSFVSVHVLDGPA